MKIYYADQDININISECPASPLFGGSHEDIQGGNIGEHTCNIADDTGLSSCVYKTFLSI